LPSLNRTRDLLPGQAHAVRRPPRLGLLLELGQGHVAHVQEAVPEREQLHSLAGARARASARHTRARVARRNWGAIVQVRGWGWVAIWFWGTEASKRRVAPECSVCSQCFQFQLEAVLRMAGREGSSVRWKGELLVLWSRQTKCTVVRSGGRGREDCEGINVLDTGGELEA